MWVQAEDSAAAESDEESGLSSEDEGDIQCEILEMQRDEANQRLAELEEVSNQLLKEMNVLEIQFQIERSCRESAEALAVKVTKENKVLKRKSQMLMPLIPEQHENLPTLTFDLEPDPAFNCDVVDLGEDSNEETLLLESQAKIAELQASVDGLLAEKLQLQQQVEDLTKEQAQLREQLALEVEEKEAILRKMSKQSKTMNKIKRVSQLVTEEFAEMSQKLELEQGLRQHAEVFAHQMMAQQTAANTQSMSAETGLQLQQALEQISTISTALCDIQRYYQDQAKQTQSVVEDSSVLSERQSLREQLEKSEEERKALDTQLCEANGTVTQLQEEVNQLKNTLKREDKPEEPGESGVLSELHSLREQLEKSEEERKALETQLCESNGTVTLLQEEVKQLQVTLNKEDKPVELQEKSTPAPPPLPPPPPPPPPSTTVTSSIDFMRSRRKEKASKVEQNEPAPLLSTKAKAVDEMMERIKKGIILRPIKRIQDDDSSWKDQKSENRKSAIVELKGMLDNIKRQPHRRVPSRRGIGRNVGEAELLQVLQRRRRAMGENQDLVPSTQPQDPKPGDVPWASESGCAPVLRRLKQNREKRDSRIRASALIIGQGN